MNLIQQDIHEQLVAAAKGYKKMENILIELLPQAGKLNLYSALGFPSLYQYCVTALKLSESQSYQLIGIARKSEKVPELKKAIVEGKITVSNARRIVSVITPENKDTWIEKAANLSQRELEFEVVKENPRKITKERIKPVEDDRCELKTYISRKLEQNLRRLQDVLSQKIKSHVSLEKAIEFMVEECLEKHDPIRKAERNIGKPVAKDAQLCLRVVEGPRQRKPIPADIKHQVILRDQNQCTYKDKAGHRCQQRRWIQIHHVIPVAKGGTNTITNLKTLCFGHHRQLHNRSRA